MAHFNELEVKCIQVLANRFQRGEHFVGDFQEFVRELGVDERTYGPLMRTMAANGFISVMYQSDAGQAVAFDITAEAVQAAREVASQQVAAQAPKDIVEQVQTTLRQWKPTGWIIVAGLVILAVVTFVNQFWELLIKIGWVQGPAK
jgi:hypothetical protein